MKALWLRSLALFTLLLHRGNGPLCLPPRSDATRLDIWSAGCYYLTPINLPRSYHPFLIATESEDASPTA